MSFFDKVKGALTSGREELTRQVGRYKNKKFMQLSLIHISEPTRPELVSRMPSSA